MFHSSNPPTVIVYNKSSSTRVSHSLQKHCEMTLLSPLQSSHSSHRCPLWQAVSAHPRRTRLHDQGISSPLVCSSPPRPLGARPRRRRRRCGSQLAQPFICARMLYATAGPQTGRGRCCDGRNTNWRGSLSQVQAPARQRTASTT